MFCCVKKRGSIISKLTPKQEKFVQGLISGLSQRESYKQAYNAANMKDNTIDERACRLFKEYKINARYSEIMEEHKGKALYTREEAVNDLIWIKEEAREDVKKNGISKNNAPSFIAAIKELSTLNDIYPKDKQDNNKQEKEVAEALRGLVDAINA